MKIKDVNDYFLKIIDRFNEVGEVKSFSFDIEFLNDDESLIEKRTFGLTDKEVWD